MEWIIAVFMGIILFFCIVMLIDGNRFVIKEYTIVTDKIDTKVTFALLADLHNKTYGEANGKLLAAIKKISPNVILVAGDILTAKPGKSFENAAAFMENLASVYPVYYGLGNHEYRMKIYPEDYKDAYERYMKRMKDAGIKILDNKTAKIRVTEPGGDKSGIEHFVISVTGASIERNYYKRFTKTKMKSDYLKRLLGEVSEDEYRILLAHNPEYFEEYADWGADLVLSGHVHGGIMKLPLLGGVISPKLVLFPKYDGGRFERRKTTMILSRGLGMHTIPIRIFNPGELVVIHLKPCK